MNEEAGPPHTAGSQKRLYRSRSERMVAGVAGGMAEYLHLDPSLVRIGWVAVLIFTALLPGLLLYIACALIVPEEPVA